MSHVAVVQQQQQQQQCVSLFWSVAHAHTDTDMCTMYTYIYNDGQLEMQNTFNGFPHVLFAFICLLSSLSRCPAPFSDRPPSWLIAILNLRQCALSQIEVSFCT